LVTDSIAQRAAKWGIETEHWDGLGHQWKVEPPVLEQILAAIAAKGAPRQQPESLPIIPAYQGRDSLPRRSWALIVQLYSVRSRRNWGHGDFTDLENLIVLTAGLGAAGVGLNPLHALFDDRADDASPYFPSSRFFLNPLYIDVEAVPEFAPSGAAEHQSNIEALRQQEFVDYSGVAKAKSDALAHCYEYFCSRGAADRHSQFDEFRREQGATLTFYAAFEFLRRRYVKPWWEWPDEWQKPNKAALVRLRRTEAKALGYFEYVQWIAHEQLLRCCTRIDQLDLPLGLYLDLAVGVRPDGFDAWHDQDFILRTIEIGAPPDRLNTQGQRWGLAGFNPAHLIKTHCEPFRKVLRASMQYAGAVRIDHILGLKRFYLVPRDRPANRGAYVHFPFEAMLATTADESRANDCIVIGEDLGTVPSGFRETLSDWGLWSYQVMLFERAADGGFIAPDHYRENALVTFGTHDLPTFSGWLSGHDLAIKRALGIDPGESDGDRAFARDALHRTMAWRGLPNIDLLSVMRFLAETPTRLLAVNIEDALGLIDQVNVPGTVAEHPNWRRRLPVNLDEILARGTLASISELMAAAGRSIGGSRERR